MLPTFIKFIKPVFGKYDFLAIDICFVFYTFNLMHYPKGFLSSAFNDRAVNQRDDVGHSFYVFVTEP